MFGKILDTVTETASNFVKDPVGTSVDMATQPFRDAANIIDGLSEGELRAKAALRLGADVAAGMAIGELVEWYQNE